MADITLVRPPIEDFYITPVRLQPLGLAYLTAALREKDLSVKVLDCVRSKGKTVRPPKELAQLQSYYTDRKDPYSLCYGPYRHFGPGWGVLEEDVAAIRSSVWGISSQFTPYGKEALKTAALIRKHHPDSVIIAGGQHATFSPNLFLKDGLCDAVLTGYAEETLPVFVEKVLRKGIDGIEPEKGIILKRCDGQDSRFAFAEIWKDMIPAHDILQINRYMYHKKRMAVMSATRGCSRSCAFCINGVFAGKFSIRAVSSVIEEMEILVNKYDVEVLDFEDDMLNGDVEFFRGLLKAVKDRFYGRIELTAMNGLMLDRLTSLDLRLMADAGFKTLNIAPGTYSPCLREDLCRPLAENDHTEAIIQEASALGLNTVCYVFVGMPGQTIKEVIATVAALALWDCSICPSIFYPVVGSPLYEQCAAEGLINKADYVKFRSTAICVETVFMTREDVLELCRLMRVIEYDRRINGKGVDNTKRSLTERIKRTCSHEIYTLFAEYTAAAASRASGA